MAKFDVTQLIGEVEELELRRRLAQEGSTWLQQQGVSEADAQRLAPALHGGNLFLSKLRYHLLNVTQFCREDGAPPPRLSGAITNGRGATAVTVKTRDEGPQKLFLFATERYGKGNREEVSTFYTVHAVVFEAESALPFNISYDVTYDGEEYGMEISGTVYRPVQRRAGRIVTDSDGRAVVNDKMAGVTGTQNLGGILLAAAYSDPDFKAIIQSTRKNRESREERRARYSQQMAENDTQQGTVTAPPSLLGQLLGQPTPAAAAPAGDPYQE